MLIIDNNVTLGIDKRANESIIKLTSSEIALTNNKCWVGEEDVDETRALKSLKIMAVAGAFFT